MKELEQQALAMHQQQSHSLRIVQHGLVELQDHLASSPSLRNEMQLQQLSQLVEELRMQQSRDQETIRQLQMELRKTQVREGPWAAGQEGLLALSLEHSKPFFPHL